MLTLKEPIQLHTVQPMSVAGQGFGQRIIGNYDLLSSRYEPKDLLFLLTAPPELPEDLGGMTTIVEDQSVRSVQNVTMDVVNHVVNRILLDGTSSFTYQDQVYITSVLNRLGITNVEQFMREVRRLRVENESVVNMTQLYRTQLNQLLARQAAGEELPKLPLPSEKGEEEEQVRTQDPGLTMALSILNRLDTANIYETVHAYRQNWTINDRQVQQNTLRLTEQLRFSNAIELAEMKQRVFQDPEITLLNHWNRYEHYDIAVPAATEAQVLRQAAAAALLTAVDNTVVEVLNCPTFHEQWLHVEDSLWQTAENTLNRFETYHSWEGLTAPELPPAEDRQWNYYIRELRQYQSLEQRLLPLLGETARLRPLGEEPSAPEELKLQFLEQAGEEEEAPEGQISLPRREEQPTAPGQTTTPLELELLQQSREAAPAEETLLRREELTQRETLLRQTVERIQTEGRAGQPGQRAVPTPPVQAGRERELSPVELELLQQQSEAPETEEQAQAVREQLTLREQLVRETIQRVQTEGRSGQPGEPAVPTPPVQPGPGREPAPVERELLTPGEAEVVAPEALTQTLTQIDRENRQTLERVTRELQQQAPKAPRAPSSPDLRRTMRDALRAMDDPAAVLSQLPFTPAKMDRPTPFTPEEEAILRQATPEDRALYQRVLTISHDPEGALLRGLAKPASLGSFQADLMQANRRQQLELEHRLAPERAETERILEQSEAVLERFQQVPGPHTVIRETVDRRPALKFVHKEASPDISEELMEQLREQRTQSLVERHTDEQVERHDSHTTHIDQTQHQVVTSTTQDVTELVNKTLARQMRTISDQVYRQMEKKLQLERNRRGRF